MRVSVHVLRHGRALCQMVHGVPGKWGPQHRWVSFLDPHAHELATCCTCVDALALIPREVLASAPPAAVERRP